MNDTYTSTGAKFFAHQEAMANLRNGKGQPIVTHVMLTDVCNHRCAFCSVQARAGDSLPLSVIVEYLQTLKTFGLKAVILSGGGNPILYRNAGADFNDVVNCCKYLGLEVGLITNGMPMKGYTDYRDKTNQFRPGYSGVRTSWKTVRPETLDSLTWIRISMSGLDHEEREVFVPDIDPSKTTLGFSYVAHDVYHEPDDPHHGQVSTRHDLLSGNKERAPDVPFKSRITELIDYVAYYVNRFHPQYVRLLPNCLEPELISGRVTQLEHMANVINLRSENDARPDYHPAFVQHKPPQAPHACYLGYIHPVLNCDGWVYPCDSCVLNETAGHQFANPWRICRWDEVEKMYTRPVRSLITDPAKTCPGCVFTKSNEILKSVVDGVATPAPKEVPIHVNFV